MQLDCLYKKLDVLPSESILNYPLDSVEWDSWISSYDIHKESKSLPIVLTDSSKLDGVTRVLDGQSELKSLVLAECNKLEEYYSGTVKWAILLCIPPGKATKAHVDRSLLFKYTHRCHLPLKTSIDAKFVFGSTSTHLEQGSWYEVNNLTLHKVVNSGTENRIHLMVDILPNLGNTNETI